jgi:hypothetical protein
LVKSPEKHLRTLEIIRFWRLNMKNETKGIAPLIIAIVVIVVAAGVGVGAYVATRGGGGTSGGDIGSATSLSCKVDVTVPDQGTMTLDLKAKNLQNTANLMIRMEGTMYDTSVIYIINAAQSKGWICTADIWQEMSVGDFSTYQAQLTSYPSQLSGWTGGDYTYTDPTTGYSVKIYAIEVNPTLDDSLFTHAA